MVEELMMVVDVYNNIIIALVKIHNGSVWALIL